MLLEKPTENIMHSQETYKCIIKEINLEFSFEEQMVRLKLSLQTHYAKTQFFGKGAKSLGKVEGRRSRACPQQDGWTQS